MKKTYNNMDFICGTNAGYLRLDDEKKFIIGIPLISVYEYRTDKQSKIKSLYEIREGIFKAQKTLNKVKNEVNTQIFKEQQLSIF